LPLAGCPAGDGPARSEAASVSRAVDALRAAENPQKASHLAALRALPCSVPDVCGVQSLCLAAYEEHVHALELIDKVKAIASSAPVEQVKADLMAADASLGKAKLATEDCTAKQGALIRRFRVGR
jgi:hypothetical protein